MSDMSKFAPLISPNLSLPTLIKTGLHFTEPMEESPVGEIALHGPHKRGHLMAIPLPPSPPPPIIKEEGRKGQEPEIAGPGVPKIHCQLISCMC